MPFDSEKFNLTIEKAIHLFGKNEYQLALDILEKFDQKYIVDSTYTSNFRSTTLILMAQNFYRTEQYYDSENALLRSLESPAISETMLNYAENCYAGILAKANTRIISSNSYPNFNNHDYEIYQVSYSEETKVAFYPFVKCLDNTSNSRQDWREYWPIRNFLLTNEVFDEKYYAFLSPRFFSKTGVNENQFINFLAEHQNSGAVISFSPYYDQKVLYRNSIFQGEKHHNGLLTCFSELGSHTKDKYYKVNGFEDSQSTIFCNYFVAKGYVWRKWLKLAEFIFYHAESEVSAYGKLLRSKTKYKNQNLELKVFVIERIINYLISMEDLKVETFPQFRLGMPSYFMDQRKANSLSSLDALKKMYTSSMHTQIAERYKTKAASLHESIASYEKENY